MRKTFAWGAVSVYESPTFKATVIISKKTLKKAHDRNRLRRRIYAALQGATASKGLIIFPRREALTTPFTQLVSDFKSLF